MEEDEECDDEEWTDETTETKDREPKRVHIIVTTKSELTGEPLRYTCHDKEGGCFTSVGFMASIYGSSCPCDTEEEVQRQIQSCKDLIIRNGDIPIVKDERQVVSLSKWF